MKKVAVLIIFFFTYGCSKHEHESENINYVPIVKLNLIEKLNFFCDEHFFVGIIEDLEVLNDRIYISDRTSCQIHVFNINFEYLYSSLECGNGPNEFNRAPLLTKDKDNLVVYGIGDMRDYYYLDDKFNKIRKIITPKDFIPEITNPVFLNTEIVIGAFNKSPFSDENRKNITVAILLRKTGEILQSFCKFDEIYTSNEGNGFFYSMTTSLLSKGFDNTIVVLQGASTIYHLFDYHGNPVKSLNYTPRYFESPPQLSINKIRSLSEKERFEKFYSKATAYKKMFFDEKNELLYVCYYKLTEESIKSKSHVGVLSYLLIIDKNNRCIYDDKIEGYMASVEDGNIYTIVSEGDNIVLNKYVVEELVENKCTGSPENGLFGK